LGYSEKKSRNDVFGLYAFVKFSPQFISHSPPNINTPKHETCSAHYTDYYYYGVEFTSNLLDKIAAYVFTIRNWDLNLSTIIRIHCVIMWIRKYNLLLLCNFLSLCSLIFLGSQYALLALVSNTSNVCISLSHNKIV
jgi:hypothetical protein